MITDTKDPFRYLPADRPSLITPLLLAWPWWPWWITWWTVDRQNWIKLDPLMSIDILLISIVLQILFQIVSNNMLQILFQHSQLWNTGQIWSNDSTSQCRNLLDASAHSASAPASADFGSLVLAESYQVIWCTCWYGMIWVSLWIENAFWEMAVTSYD